MLTVLLASLGSFISEASSSIVKFKADHRHELVFPAAFIKMVFGAAVFILLAGLRGSFVFTLASWPTFGLRAILEIAQMHVTMLALVKADRSTDAFIRNLTIPLLLIADLIIGFTVSTNQWLGIVVVLSVIGIILSFRVISLKGVGYPLFTAVNSVATISLFKYNITHFNSVEGEQFIIFVILAVYFYIITRFLVKEKISVFLKNKAFLGQGVFFGFAALAGSFAVAFGNPAIAVTAKRASAVLAGIISGRQYFQEKKFAMKIIASVALIGGLVLLAL